MIIAPPGLADVVVTSTVLSDVDGENGRLVIRGLPVEAVAGRIPFEEMAARLWEGFAEIDDPRRALGDGRAYAFGRLAKIFPHLANLPIIDGLRGCLASLGDDESILPHLLVTAAMPVVAAALARLQQGLDPVAPDPTATHAHDFLRMLAGEPPPKARAWALDAYLTSVSDHGMNASTFTARVVASTRAGMVASVVAALCALKGPLHGGAPGPVLDMLDFIGTEERAAAWIAERLAAGQRLMGFGHRIYRVRDPRADVLRHVVERLREEDASPRLALAEKVEQTALEALRRHKPDRPLQTNVEFYTALVLEAVGLDRTLFTPAFAAGRVLGWTAHVFEQEREGKLMRPQSKYVGP